MLSLNRTNQNDYQYNLYQEYLTQIKKNSLLYANNPELVIKYFKINIAKSNNIDNEDDSNLPGYQASESSKVHGTGMFNNFRNFTYDIFEFTPIIEMTPFQYSPNSEANPGASGNMSLMTIGEPSVGDIFMYYTKNNSVDQTEIFQVNSVQLQRTSNNILPIYQLEYKTANITLETLKEFSIADIYFYDNLQNDFTSAKCWEEYDYLSNKVNESIKNINNLFNKNINVYEFIQLVNTQEGKKLVKTIPLLFNNLIKRISGSSYNQSILSIVKNISTNISIEEFLKVNKEEDFIDIVEKQEELKTTGTKISKQSTLLLEIKEESDDELEEESDDELEEESDDELEEESDDELEEESDDELEEESDDELEEESDDELEEESDDELEEESDDELEEESDDELEEESDDELEEESEKILKNLKRFFVNNNTFIISNLMYLYLFYLYRKQEHIIFSKLNNYIIPNDIKIILDSETSEELFNTTYEKYQTDIPIAFVDKNLLTNQFLIIDNITFLLNLPVYNNNINSHEPEKIILNKVQTIINNNFLNYLELYKYLKSTYKLTNCTKKYIKFQDELEAEKELFKNNKPIKNTKYFNIFNCSKNIKIKEYVDEKDKCDLYWGAFGNIIDKRNNITLPIGELDLPIAISFQYGVQYN